jgi:hypothetical protein
VQEHDVDAVLAGGCLAGRGGHCGWASVSGRHRFAPSSAASGKVSTDPVTPCAVAQSDAACAVRKKLLLGHHWSYMLVQHAAKSSSGRNSTSGAGSGWPSRKRISSFGVRGGGPGLAGGAQGGEDAEDVVGAPGPEPPPVELDLVAVGMDAQPGRADDAAVGVNPEPGWPAQPEDRRADIVLGQAEIAGDLSGRCRLRSG